MARTSASIRRKKKNPTTAQLVVLGVGTTIGVGLLGYGIYLVVKKPTDRWEYQVVQTGPVFLALVWPPGDEKGVTVGSVPDYGAAIALAIAHIKSQGGIPVPRGAA